MLAGSSGNGGYLACFKRVWSVSPDAELKRQCAIPEWFSYLSFFLLFSGPLLVLAFLDIAEEAAFMDAVVVPAGYALAIGAIVFVLMPLLALVAFRSGR